MKQNTNLSTELYLKNKKTIHCKAAQFKKRASGVEFDDLLGEANLTFMMCMKNYRQDEHTKFNTYLSKALDYNLSKYIIFYSVEWTELIDYMMDFEVNNIDQFNYTFWIKSLSKKAQQIIDLIFSAPVDCICSNKTKKITQQSLSKYLQECFLWSKKEINYHFNEIKLALSSY